MILDTEFQINDKIVTLDWSFKIVSIDSLPNETVKRFKGITIDGRYYVSGIMQQALSLLMEGK